MPADSEPSEIIVCDSIGNALDRIEPRCAPVLADGPATLDVQIRAVDPCQ
jgi:hypothetical protein